jgi:DNA polymerase (family 10)
MGFDWCVASVHSHFELDRAAQTKRVLSAIHDPSVRMIGHLTARMIGGRPPIDLDLAAVCSAARDTKTALEINGALPRLDPAIDVLRVGQAHDVTFLLTSDAHQVSELSLVDFAALHAHRAQLPPAQVANAWEGERLRSWLDSH